MKTIQLVDKKGNILEVVDKPGFVVPDGFALKTRMVLMELSERSNQGHCYHNRRFE